MKKIALLVLTALLQTSMNASANEYGREYFEKTIDFRGQSITFYALMSPGSRQMYFTDPRVSFGNDRTKYLIGFEGNQKTMDVDYRAMAEICESLNFVTKRYARNSSRTDTPSGGFFGIGLGNKEVALFHSSFPDSIGIMEPSEHLQVLNFMTCQMGSPNISIKNVSDKQLGL